MKIEYKEIIPSPIKNATVMLMTADGVERGYTVSANEGYKLHDNTCDITIDIAGAPLDSPIKGYCHTASCGKNYDFAANQREFYAVAEKK